MILATETTTALPVPPLPAVPSAIALFLDVDGTLLEFAPRPDGVVVDAALPALLERVEHSLGGALAVLSGRSLQRIDELLGLPQLAAAGSHGAELRRGGGTVVRAVRDSHGMSALRAYAAALLAEVPGVVIEHKPDAIALHWRAAPSMEAVVEETAQRLVRAGGSGYRLQHGDCVVELRGAGADKGDALRGLMQHPPFAGRTPWMIGDDLTDEHAFDAAERAGGYGIIVGARRPTRARYALADPAAVHRWLAALAAHSPEASA
ncbi:trehalose-phosphatase [Dokdonella fugitiva]|jgi:trehalose 6-phosphate phosphatase|uniref:Trehalose 6-phosphate phosphatase n=1 Tax=Dokdonella fugitiva TaxID=328517 RepID=A0A4R2I2L7_9GAMM|nr:trehalose-phosphatase [Dokdonella fugitiva]MBA8885487.1 trehalose 6-phosphate phosphatase [Dokdonella fugitiva]TCO38341.1 trehalose 6-phosphate phosphatase [Dokdonella fugitiva]